MCSKCRPLHVNISFYKILGNIYICVFYIVKDSYRNPATLVHLLHKLHTSSFCVLMERTCKHSLSHVLVFDHMNLNGSVDISASSGSTPCRCKYHWDTVRKKTRKPIYTYICFHMIQICKEETHLHMIDTLGGVQTAGSLWLEIQPSVLSVYLPLCVWVELQGWPYA